MTIIQRLKMELGNREYFPEDQYVVFLDENNLNYSSMYKKETHKVDLLRTCIDILEAVANDIDIMMSISTEMGSTSAAYGWLMDRINYLREKLNDLENIDQCEFDPYNPFNLMITRQNVGPIPIRVKYE